MKILIIHNYYQQPGGECLSFASESALLESHGNRVIRYTVHNDQIKEMNSFTLVERTLWNRAVANDLRKIIHQNRPEIVHFQNTFPLISPSAYYVVKALGIPVIQTLRNYRLLCPNALFLRNGRICEDCMGKFVPWPSVLHACYRGSRVATGVTAGMLLLHRALRTWRRMVNRYITLTDFARVKFIQGGLPAEKIAVKPNFIEFDPGNGRGQGGYALFVGRLSLEKGIRTLLAAWKKIGGKVPLKIVGNGPLAPHVAEASVRISGVEWLGHKSRQCVFELMKDAVVLIFPSICYETFGRTIIEAYSVGLPVIASNLGGMSSIIEHKHTGLHFRPGDPEDLSEKVEWILNHPAELERMRQEARKEYEEKYTAERNYEMLMDIYKRAIARAH